MAIVVEDGSGKSDAEAYIDVAYFATFCARRLDLSAYTLEQQESAIAVSAQDWIDKEHIFASERLVGTQALKFPTVDDGLPSDIKEANAYAALMQIQGLLLIDYSSKSVLGEIESESKSISTMSKTVSYREGTAQRYARDLPSGLKNLLQPYLYGGMGGMRRW